MGGEAAREWQGGMSGGGRGLAGVPAAALVTRGGGLFTAKVARLLAMAGEPRPPLQGQRPSQGQVTDPWTLHDWREVV